MGLILGFYTKTISPTHLWYATCLCAGHKKKPTAVKLWVLGRVTPVTRGLISKAYEALQ